MAFLKNNRTAIIIFLLALFLRLVVLYLAGALYNFKFEYLAMDDYFMIADNLKNYGSFAKGDPLTGIFWLDSVRTPGFPFLLHLFFYLPHGILIFLTLQCVVGSFLSILGRKVALVAGSSLSVANFIGIFLAVDPLGLSLSTIMMTDTFFTIFFLLAVLYILFFLRQTDAPAAVCQNTRLIILGALFLGAANLFRPATYYLPLVLIIGWLFYRIIMRKKIFLIYVILFFLVSYSVVTPWLIRNYRTFHTFSYSANKELVLFIALAPAILSFKNHQTLEDAQADFFRQEGLKKFPTLSIDSAAWYRERALAVLKQNPKEFLQVSGVVAYTFFTHDGVLNFLGTLGRTGDIKSLPHGLSVLRLPLSDQFNLLRQMFFSPLFLVILFRIFWVAVTILLLFSVIFQIITKKTNIFWWFLFISVLYFAATSISNGLAVNGRFRFPVNSLVLIMTAQGIAIIYQFVKKFIKIKIYDK